MPVRRDFYRELAELGSEKAVALFNLVEVVIFSYFQGRRDGQDTEIVAALQAFRRTLSPLHVPAAPMPVFAEHLKKEYDTFKKQNPQQIPICPPHRRYWTVRSPSSHDFPVRTCNHNGSSVGSSAMCEPTIRKLRNT